MASMAERLRAQQGRVGEDDEDVVLTVEVVGEGGEADGYGVAGAPLHRLLDEFDRDVGDELLLDRLGDVFGAVPDDDDDAVERERGERVEHVQQHGTAAQRVQHLGVPDRMRVPSPAAGTTAVSGRRR